MKSLKTRLVGAATALTAAAAITLTSATPAHAFGVGEVATAIGYAKQAYDAYEKYFGNQLTLEQAEAQIEAAITQAQSAIIAEIDRLAAGEIQACSRDAVTNFPDLPHMSPDTAMALATETTHCVDLAQAQIANVGTTAAVDLIGFALNTVGPIALMARAHVGFSTTTLRQTIVSAHQQNIQRLTPTDCSADPLWGDAWPGDPVEVVLTCHAYNGDIGQDSIWLNIRHGQPLPWIDYTEEINMAVAGTSYPVSQAALNAI
jgi:hypothetical protein